MRNFTYQNTQKKSIQYFFFFIRFQQQLLSSVSRFEFQSSKKHRQILFWVEKCNKRNIYSEKSAPLCRNCGEGSKNCLKLHYVAIVCAHYLQPQEHKIWRIKTIHSEKKVFFFIFIWKNLHVIQNIFRAEKKSLFNNWFSPVLINKKFYKASYTLFLFSRKLRKLKNYSQVMLNNMKHKKH